MVKEVDQKNGADLKFLALIISFFKSYNRCFKFTIYLIFSLFLAGFFLFVFFYKIEVVAPGSGIAEISDSDVVINSPESAYVINLRVSRSSEIEKGQALLVYRNLDDDYQLRNSIHTLEYSKKRKQQIEDELCFLFSDRFSELKDDAKYKEFDCQSKLRNFISEGANYILEFYKDYKQEKLHFLEFSETRIRRKNQLLDKRGILDKKRKTLLSAGAATTRYYDLQAEIVDLNIQLVDFDLSEIDGQKLVKDKLNIFLLRRSERALELRNEHNRLIERIIEEENQVAFLSEKKKLSVIYSPINGSVLKMPDGLTENTFIEKGSELFVLKKEGAATEITAKIDSRHRGVLVQGAKVKLRLASPGMNYLFNGQIMDVSADSLEYDPGNPESGRYYEITVYPEDRFFESKINPGVSVEVFVVSDQATVFDYILGVFPSYPKVEVW